MFKHHSKTFSYSPAVSGVVTKYWLHWYLDFIAAHQKRLRRLKLFKKGQKWVHEVRFRKATIYVYPVDQPDAEPLTFPQKLYSDVTEPKITLYLVDEELMTEEEHDASL
jgi:hypothetical protein